MRKKIWLLVALIGLIALLSGCTQINEPITSESEGIWNSYFVYPLSEAIKYIANIFNENYGAAIIVITAIIRLIVLPLNIKQLKSSQAMQEVQPKLQEIQKKYSSKDKNTQQKLQEETMKLFQEHNVNPLAGCLPIIVQMPVLIALYHAIRRTPEIQEGSFLWFQLGSPDPLHILPFIAGAAMFLQQRLMMSGNQGAAQNPQMKVMMYIMPIMIMVIAFIFPSALALYLVVSNVFMVAQTLFIRKPMMKKQENGGSKK
ncbi:YidC family membrane integrase SpoIIIJ [Barrientosiimonas marina]|uniref:Membrane protein insertase YidC n=1 Tax=Lentibacillus kimchii TaxID=1542911 RepID=A0ABW2UWP3_9BACI